MSRRVETRLRQAMSDEDYSRLLRLLDRAAEVTADLALDD
ncbi:hypothetical protein GCM10023193_08310 [Planotetraspora kaengkrachanensis]